MDFSNAYNPEQEAFAREVGAWLDQNIPQELTRPRDILLMSRQEFDMRRDFCRKLGAKGWLYPRFPKEYGGGGLSSDLAQVVQIEMVARGLSLPPIYDSGRLAAPTVMACGTEEQKERFLPPILTGESVTWQLFTEPEAGTDEANQQTNALRSERDQDHFVVNGGKIFVGGIYAPPDQFLLLTRSDLKAPRHQNLAMFLAPADLEGVTIMPLDLFPAGTFGQVCYETGDSAPGVKHSVFFEDVRIPDSYLIGGENEGWRVTTATLTVEHGDRGGEHVASSGAAYIPRNLVAARLLAQCRDNPHIRRRVEENPILQDAMVEAYIDAEIERLFYTRNTALPRAGRRAPYAGPQVSLHTKELGLKLTNLMARLLGPYAMTHDAEYGLEDRLFEVGERAGICIAPGGTPEALKIVISRALRIGR